MKLLFSNPRPIFVRDSADMNAPLIIGAAAFLFRYRYFYNDLSGPHSGHRNQMYVVGGLIVGNPTDTRESVEANLAFARRYVDWPYIQHPTPYPGTPMTKEFQDRGLIVSEDVDEYDGTTAVVRSEHLDAEEIEFMRWRAERWMKLRHLPVALRHDPGFVLRHGHQMLRHTFRGSSVRTWLGLESERTAFTRYKQIRKAERRYVG